MKLIEIPNHFLTCVTCVTLTPFSGKSYEKIVQKKDPGNRENGVHGARCGTAHFSKRFVTCPVRCLVYRSIVKRPAKTGSRLGRYKESGQPPGSGGVGAGLAVPGVDQPPDFIRFHPPPRAKTCGGHFSAIQSGLKRYILEPEIL